MEAPTTCDKCGGDDFRIGALVTGWIPTEPKSWFPQGKTVSAFACTQCGALSLYVDPAKLGGVTVPKKSS
jgi:hypothetical protein